MSNPIIYMVPDGRQAARPPGNRRPARPGAEGSSGVIWEQNRVERANAEAQNAAHRHRRGEGNEPRSVNAREIRNTPGSRPPQEPRPTLTEAWRNGVNWVRSFFGGTPSQTPSESAPVPRSAGGEPTPSRRSSEPEPEASAPSENAPEPNPRRPRNRQEAEPPGERPSQLPSERNPRENERESIPEQNSPLATLIRELQSTGGVPRELEVASFEQSVITTGPTGAAASIINVRFEGPFGRDTYIIEPGAAASRSGNRITLPRGSFNRLVSLRVQQPLPRVAPQGTGSEKPPPQRPTPSMSLPSNIRLDEHYHDMYRGRGSGGGNRRR